MPVRPDIVDDRSQGGGEGVRARLVLGRPENPRHAKPYPSRLGSLEGRPGTFADNLPLVFRKGREDVNHELVGVWVVARHELDAALHDAGDEVDIAGEPVELRDDERRADPPARRECLEKLGAVFSLPALHFGELGRDHALATSPADVIEHGGALRLKAEAALPLAVGGNTIVGDEFRHFRSEVEYMNDRSHIPLFF